MEREILHDMDTRLALRRVGRRNRSLVFVALVDHSQNRVGAAGKHCARRRLAVERSVATNDIHSCNCAPRGNIDWYDKLVSGTCDLSNTTSFSYMPAYSPGR